MKLTALATTAILAALAMAASTPTPDRARPRPRIWYARLQFPKSKLRGWFPSQKILDHKINADLGRGTHYDWSAEDWAAHVLLQCKGTDALTSKDKDKEPFWSGYLFAYDIQESNFTPDTKGVERSIGYYNGFADKEPLPPLVESEEQHVLDL